MQRLEYSDLACYLQADDLEPLPTDIFDFIDELELHDCAHSQPNRAGALPGKLVAPVDQGQVQPAGGAGAGSPPGSNKVTDSRIDRIRQRNREAQARFRLKQKGHREEVETKIQVTQAAISQARRKIKVHKQTQEKLAKRKERVDTMLEATLHLTSAVHLAEDNQHQPTLTAALVQQPQTQPPNGRKRMLSTPECMSLAPRPGYSQLYHVPGLAPPSLTSFLAHIPLFYKSILQHSGTTTVPAFTEHPACTALYNCSVSGGMRGKCQQFREAQAAQYCVHFSKVAWFPQMHTEVDAGVPLSFSTTLSLPQCAASFVLTYLASSLEEALCATLQDQEANAASSDPVEQYNATEPTHNTEDATTPQHPSLKRVRDSTSTQRHTTSKLAQPPVARIRKCPSPDPCWPGEPATSGVEATNTTPASAGNSHREDTARPMHVDAGRVTKEARADPPPASAAAHSHGNDSCSTISVEDDSRSSDSQDDAAMAKLPPSCSEKSAQHACAAAARVDSMYVTCGAQEQFPLVAAVRYVYRAAVERYCGRVHSRSIRKVCDSALVAIDQMLKGLYRAVEARDRSPAKSHVCTSSDGCFFRAMSDHIVGLLLTARKEIPIILQDLKSMVDAVDSRPKQSDTELQEHATSVMTTVRMGHMLLAQDCTRLLHLLMMDAVVPMMVLFEVDNMHARLFKSLQLQEGQRSTMATFWRQWEQRRRALDETSVAAIETLATVPTKLHIPDLVQAQINVLCGDKRHASLGSKIALKGGDGLGVPGKAGQQNEIACGGSGGNQGYCATADRLSVQSGGAHGGRFSHRLRRNSEQRSASHGMLQGKEPCGDEGDDRVLIGQNGRHTHAAETALKQLLSVHEADKDMYIDCLDVQMPSAVLSSAQVIKLWSASLMHEGPPFDFMGLCQMAALQERRIDLLHKQSPSFSGRIPVI